MCPSFEDVVDEAAMAGFSYERYEGRWYAFVHDEPTQPTTCNCDTFDWSLTPDGQNYESHLSVDCGLADYGLPSDAANIVMRGILDIPTPGKHLEGAPDVGADYIDNYILWVQKGTTPTGEETYERSIVYSCAPNYLGMVINIFLHSSLLNIFLVNPPPKY
jgi:hypothetical protein